MNGQTSIIGMFGDGADGMTADMNRIVGRAAPGEKIAPLTAAELATMNNLLAIEGRGGFTEEQRKILNALVARYKATTGKDPYNAPVPEEEAPGAGPAAFNMLDLSSPVNTIFKSLFLLSLSTMFAGTYNFYFLSVGCTGAIIYSLFKLSNR